MILSPGFIYWDGRKRDDNDVYIKYYGERKKQQQMPFTIMFLYGNIFTTDDFANRRNNQFIVCLIFTPIKKKKRTSWNVSCSSML